MNMRVVPFYLPQFHRVPENDKWWGEGYTDWVATKNARPLYEGHYQPHVPMNGKYYDLLDKSTMEWQASLMKKYGIDGICMYHYWFENGKKILEKPAENLLQWKDIDMPYCFYWDNRTWSKSWSAAKDASSWLEGGEDENNDGILIQQKYGFYDQWREHFNYLLPFFRDERYIKIDGRPVFLIFYPWTIYCLEEMVAYWRTLAKQSGIPEPFIIGNQYYFVREKAKYLDGHIYHAPMYNMQQSSSYIPEHEGLKIMNAHEIWDSLLAKEDIQKGIFYSGFLGYDDTPRRGKKGTVIERIDAQDFLENMKKLFAKNYVAGSDIVFFNAWNEWGEGMHLEPDQRDELKYLENISLAKKEFLSYCPEYQDFSDVDHRITSGKSSSDKFEKYLTLLDIWMELRERKISIKQYFEKYHLKKVLLYGYGIFARHLMQELGEDDIRLRGIIDREKEKIVCKYPVYAPNEKLPEHDVIVITSWYYLSEILREFPNEKMVSIKTILQELYD